MLGKARKRARARVHAHAPLTCLCRHMASLSGAWQLISNIFATASYAVLVLAYVRRECSFHAVKICSELKRYNKL